ncbi:thioesterase domain-containing protein [Glycomyces xiaoerkulensis]|uniref:thioesterase domain-containing protein n=1 Tax=Glycomyces xiaoerkulensis TaxID=2038139 RepID=UPI000C2634BF|nr:thioesterase domain-containing protein [Glycomyces xiaoerkulensis]
MGPSERRPAAFVRAFGHVERPQRRVIAVHPGGLPVAHYDKLASALWPETALHAVDLEREPSYFQAALDGGRTTATVPEIAERAAADLRAAGLFDLPWTLVGWSFGGVVGHALTALLTEAELPERVVLLDSIAPVPDYTPDGDEIGPDLVLPWFCMYLAAKRGGDLPPPAAALERGADIDELLTEVLETALSVGVLGAGTEPPGLRKVYDTYLDGLRRNNTLAERFAPPPARAPLTLLRPDRGLLETPDPLGWEQLGDDLAVERVPGDHYSMLQDPVAVKLIANAADPAAEPSSQEA